MEEKHQFEVGESIFFLYGDGIRKSPVLEKHQGLYQHPIREESIKVKYVVERPTETKKESGVGRLVVYDAFCSEQEVAGFLLEDFNLRAKTRGP